LRGCSLVSVVIPTHRRPQWVVCAVQSALRQSYAPLEVIVVVDGADPETVRLLQGIEGDRVRLILLAESAGGSEARNVGTRAANGEWVAFLDDDDRWVAEKLERQMRVAADIQADYPIVSSRLWAQSQEGSCLLPRRLYRTGENVADYLFCRDGFSYGDGMLQTSTLLTKRSLLLDVPFLKGLKRHQDWDWLLRVASRPGVEIMMLPEALTLMRVAGQGESVSRTGDWKASLAWAKQARPRMSARAYSFLIATECVPRARKSGAGPGAQIRLLCELLCKGRFGLKQVTLFLAFCLLPEGICNTLRSLRRRMVATDEWREYRRI
jgi:Glycosyl transferase family 2